MKFGYARVSTDDPNPAAVSGILQFEKWHDFKDFQIIT
jgi:hypothetical protein